MRDRADQFDQQKQAMMQEEFYDAEQTRAEEERIKEQKRREFAAGMQALAGGLQQVYQQVQANNAAFKQEVAAHNARVKADVDALIKRQKGMPTSHDLVTGKVTLNDLRKIQGLPPVTTHGQQNRNWTFEADNKRIERDARRVRLTQQQMRGSPFEKMCNDLRSKGATISDAECRGMAKKTIGVTRNLMGAKDLNGFVKRFCGYAKTSKERKACEPRVKREFQRAIARQK